MPLSRPTPPYASLERLPGPLARLPSSSSMRQICTPLRPVKHECMAEYYTAMGRPPFDQDRNSALAFIAAAPLMSHIERCASSRSTAYTESNIVFPDKDIRKNQKEIPPAKSSKKRRKIGFKSPQSQCWRRFVVPSSVLQGRCRVRTTGRTHILQITLQSRSFRRRILHFCWLYVRRRQ
jgi:hypothetical protein